MHEDYLSGFAKLKRAFLELELELEPEPVLRHAVRSGGPKRWIARRARSGAADDAATYCASET
ncbi:MAG TPA: hypothetical protein VMA76_03235 [Solirubrobacteraceae bacterium]|nr:hypothetical protein [Solirubrobacteraceae bacterium]